MKKIRLWLILFVASFCFQQETYAQWIDLGMKTSDFQAGQEYYLYNKDANAFFCGIGTRNDGIYYGTRAGVTTSLEAQPIIIQPALAEFVCEGTHDNGVTEWMTEWDKYTYLIQVYNSKISTPIWDELWYSVAGYNEIYTDRNNNVNNNINFFWNITKNDNGSYYISISPKASGITNETIIQGGEKLGVDLSTAGKIAYFEGYNNNSELSYEWYFVTKEEFEKIYLSEAISAPSWSDYTFIFENNDITPCKYSKAYDNPGYFYLDGDRGCFRASVTTDSESTLSFIVDGYGNHENYATTNIEVYVDGKLKKSLSNYQLCSYSSTGGNKVFLELTSGKHEIEWIITTSGEGHKSCEISNIGIERTPTISVDLLEPGSLGTEILYNVDHVKEVRKLKVIGKMNDDDWSVIELISDSIYELDFKDAEFTEIADRQFHYYASSEIRYNNLYSIILPEGLKRIGDEAFNGCNIQNIEIPSTVTEIGYKAFHQSLIESVILPDNLESFGNGAFSGTYRLKTVKLPQTIKSIPDEAFYYCKALEKCDLPKTLKFIGGSAFRFCSNLDTDIPHDIQEIGYRAFFENTKIDILIFTDNFIGFGEASFGSCSNLRYVELPVTYHTFNSKTNEQPYGNYWIFDNCWNLNTLVLKSATKVYPYYEGDKIYKPIMDNQLPGITLKVPQHLVNLYKLDEYWYNCKEIIGFTTSEIDYWEIRQPLVLDAHSRLEDNPSIKICGQGSLKINGELGMDIDTLMVDGHGNNADYSSNLIVGNDAVKVNGELYNYYYTSANRWYFISLPFNIKVSDIIAANGGKYAIRYYDGASRAQNGTSGNWKNYLADDIIEAGTGFIYQTSREGWNQFISLNDDSKQNIVSNKMITKTLSENPSETNSDKGWNLIGNPWQAYFNNHALNFTAPITVWNGSTYVAYSLIDDDYAIKPNEAFFVQCPEEINSISFPITGRQMTSVITSQSGSSARMFSDKMSNRQLIDIVISKDSLTDKTRVVVNENALEKYETDIDASKFFSMDSNVPQIYTFDSAETEYAINERPLSDGVVQLGFVAPEYGIYTISLHRNDARVVLLTDNETGVTTDLSMGEYEFRADQGTWNTRFTLKLKNSEETSIESVDSNIKQAVYAIDGGIVVEASDEHVTIFSVDGRKVAEQVVKGSAAIELSAGTYLVKTSKGTTKMSVR